MKVLELFSGYGTASFALKRLNLIYDLVGYSDIDKFANQCFKQNHCPWDTEDKLRLGNATDINPNKLRDFDLLTGGFPCQAFSVAGKGLGELDTRGTLFNEIIRIAEVKKPRYMMLENVKGLISKKHKPTFDKIISELYRIGYFVKWKVLNTKEHGIPQNRERIFFACFNRWEDFCNYEWPQTEELTLFLKDILEDEVDEKYYLSQEKVDKLLESGFKDKKFSNAVRSGGRGSVDTKHTWDCVAVGNVNPSGRGMNGNVYMGDVSPTLTTNKGEGSKIAIPVLTPDRLNKRQNGRRFKEDGEPMFTLNTQDKHGVLQLDVSQIKREGKARVYEDVSRTFNTGQGGGHTPLILQRPHGANNGGERAKDGVVPTITSGASWEHNNYLIDDTQGFDETRVYDGVSPTLRSSRSGLKVNEGYTIRKLTPKECFRLQGFLYDEVNLDGISMTQQYRLAGNGQSVNVVKKILANMLGVENE